MRSVIFAPEADAANLLVSESFFQKIAELRRYERIPEERFQKVAPAVAEALAALSGATGKQLASEKRNQMTSLRRQGLLLHLKRQRDGD